MFKVCIDTGGTFTESIVLDNDGNLNEFKTPTTPDDFSVGVINTLVEAAKYYKVSTQDFLKQIIWIVHGTTVSTNALVQRKLSRTAMITTEGFRDIIEMRRALKIETKSMYEAFIPPYQPIVPRKLRFTVQEETHYNGKIIRPINEEEVLNVIDKIRKERVEAVAICFINSYSNPENEIKAAEICKKHLKRVYITYSSDILPKMGEYERESTCVISASVGPIVSKYLYSLDSKLRKFGYEGQLLIVQANQYVQSVSSITRKPAYLTGSGPAAGPAGAVYIGDLIGESNFITADMGGTTCDAALIKNKHVNLKSGTWLGDDRLGIKVVDVVSVGAGGGSIGWVNPLGLLQVGPQSASAEPGPACYGRGGSEPTITDAALILGYLNQDKFCGGKIKLNLDLARKAINKISAPLNICLEEAALAMFTTVNHTMADCISEISTCKGYDVRDFSLFAIGGGGPLCGVFIADILGMKKTVVPRFSASFCAWSMFFLDIGRDFLRSYFCNANEAEPYKMNQLYEDMIEEAIKDFETLNVSREDLLLEKSVDIRYQGQYHMLEVKLPEGDVMKKHIAQMIADFHQMHKERYTFSLPWVPVELQNLRLIAKVKSSKIKVKKIVAGTEDPSRALISKRKCFFKSKWVNTPIYDGLRLKSGNVILGNAIIEEKTTTTIIPEGAVCHVGPYGTYIIEIRG